MKTKLILATCVAFLLGHSAYSQVCTGSFSFQTQSEVDQFLMDNPTCTQVDGNMFIIVGQDGGDPILNVDALQNIQSISGTLNFAGESLFSGEISLNNIDLSGLSSLTSVGGLNIRFQNESQDFSVLSNLQSIGSIFIHVWGVQNLNFLDQITELESLDLSFEDIGYQISGELYPSAYSLFPNLTSVNGSLTFGYNGDVGYCNTLTGFNALSHVGNLNFSTAAGGLVINHLDAFHNLQTLGTMYSDLFNLQTMSGFENLQSVNEINMTLNCDGDLPDFESLSSVNQIYFSGNANSFPDFPSLNTVDGSIIILAETNSIGFTALEEVTGLLAISLWIVEGDGCEEIQLNQLTTVGETLTIAGTAISNLNFLANLQSAGSIQITNNQNLMQCDVEYFCTNLPVIPETFTIYDNNTGCNSGAEVLASCGVSSVSGIVFYDLECDGLLNNNDYLTPFPIMNTDLFGVTGTSNSAGNYLISLEDNTSVVVYPSIVDVGVISTTSQTITTTGVTTNFSNIDFALCPTSSDFHNLSVSAMHDPFRPGFSNLVTIEIWNNSPNTENGVVEMQMIYMPGITVSNVYNGGTVSGNIISWTISELAPFSMQSVTFIFHLNASANLGDLLTWQVNATLDPSSLVDIQPEDNTVNLVSTVVGSYDPNDISVNISAYNYELLQQEETLTLDYLIRFQNTGTAEAVNIRVVNPLDVELDITSLEMISTSHAATLEVKEGNVLEWNFENIMLPDSTSNEEASHGYIHYRIKTLPGLVISDVVESTASIYFDFNEPIITNTATTVFYTCPESISTTAMSSICEGESFLAEASAGWDTYVWTLNDNVVGNGSSVELTDLTAADYTFVVHGHTDFCESESEVMVSVISSPETPIITQDENTLMANGSGLFTWTLNEETLSETGNTLEITETGLYTVSVTNGNCTSETASGTFTYTGVNETSSSLAIFPNPFDAKMTIHLTSSLIGQDIVITDMMGQEVMRIERSTNHLVEVNTMELPRGIYMVRIGNMKEIIVKS